VGKYLVAQHIAGILRKYKVNCVLDVGANRGQPSLPTWGEAPVP
jgi:hypothetical protein